MNKGMKALAHASNELMNAVFSAVFRLSACKSQCAFFAVISWHCLGKKNGSTLTSKSNDHAVLVDDRTKPSTTGVVIPQLEMIFFAK